MRKLLNRLITSFLVFILLSGLGSAFAVRTDYPDIQGHWAESTLVRALGDTLIEEAGDSLKPNDPMTSAEILTILCKVLSAKRLADISGVTDIGKDDPYDTIASQAVALGLVSPVNGRLDLNRLATRGWAFAILAEAFQLNAAEPDTSVLSKFSDGNTLSGVYRLAAASMVSYGFVEGINGALHMNANISCAEFLTVLYKILPNYLKSDKSAAAVSGGVIFSGDSTISNTVYTGTVYFDCASSSIKLQNATAPTVVVRSDSLSTLSALSCKIDRLILGQGSGDVTISPKNASGINTLAVGTGGGKITLGYGLSNVEITGNNRDVLITGSVEKLLVSGSGNNITIAPGASVKSVKITGSGAGNTVTVNGTIGECTLYGPGSVIAGTGTIQKLQDYAKNSAITANAIDTYTDKDYGLNSVALTLTVPDNVSSYEMLKASVSITAPDDSRICRGTWYIDDAFISQSDVDLGTSSAVSLNTDIKNSGNAPVTKALSFVLSFSDDEGNYQEIKAEKTVTLLNKTGIGADEALALVTTGYMGDHTLAWAKSNDYDDGAKIAWVNAKGYSSKTSYLVWVNITYQRVNIFTGSAGKWVLDRTFLVGTGATGRDTPTGVFKVIGRSTKGWTTKDYTVKPVIFFMNYAYGFHSRLYAPGTTNTIDARIGFPVSHGCVRMYDEDVAWFYDNIPTNTTVVVY